MQTHSGPLRPVAVFCVALASLITGSSAELTVEAEHRVIELPSSDTLAPFTLTNIACFISPQPHNVRWITPDGTNVLTQTGQYTVSHGEIGLPTGGERYGSLLLVQDLSYENAGVYVCEAMMDDDCLSFPKFATIQLILKMELTALWKQVTVAYSRSQPKSVELQCEASGYIRPDSDIQWFKDDKQITEGERYSIEFMDGRPDAAQTGLNETTPSRISFLTISQVKESDTGLYKCQSLATGATATTHLFVEAEQAPSTDAPQTSAPSQTSSSPSTPLTRSSQADCSVGLAAAIITTFILTAVLAGLVGFIIACLWFKGRLGRKIKSGTSSPDLGSSEHVTSRTNVSEQVDMYRISTRGAGDEIEGSGGDSPDTAESGTN